MLSAALRPSAPAWVVHKVLTRKRTCPARAHLHMHIQTRTRIHTHTFTHTHARAQHNLEEVLDLARCALHGILHASLVFVFILDTPRNELWAKYSVGDEPYMVRCAALGRAHPSQSVTRQWVERSVGKQPWAYCRRIVFGAGVVATAAAGRSQVTTLPLQVSSISDGSPDNGPAQPGAKAVPRGCG